MKTYQVYIVMCDEETMVRDGLNIDEARKEYERYQESLHDGMAIKIKNGRRDVTKRIIK